MRIAIIDMGTNTFNLLIAEAIEGGGFKPICQNKLGVMLGKGGINSGLIGIDAYQRALQAFEQHMQAVKEMEVQRVKAFATSAIRSASNGTELVRQLENTYNVEIEVISGDREAELIYRGVTASLNDGAATMLIMDIGGGSNEFIIGNSSTIFWKQSYPIGMSRLLERFSPSDPIAKTEIAAIESFLGDSLETLWEAVNRYQPQIMVGSSGSFDTYRQVIYFGRDSDEASRRIDLTLLKEFHQRMLESSIEQRRAVRGMDELRVEMIVLASILTHYVLNKTDIKDIMQSSYALKEGAVAEMLSQSEIN